MPHTCCDIFWWCTYSRRSQRSCKPGWRRMISARAKPMRERKNTHLRTKAYLKLNIRCLYWASVNRFCDDSRKSTSWVKFWALAQSADTALWHSCNRCCPSLSAHKVAPSINEHSSYMHITKENKQLKGNTWVTFAPGSDVNTPFQVHPQVLYWIKVCFQFDIKCLGFLLFLQQ